MQLPPEDSLFSLPIWKKPSGDSRTKKFQMNPSTAFQRSVPLNVQQIAVGVGMAVIVLIVIVGNSPYFMPKKQSVNVQASFNMSQSLTGTISKINKPANTFLLSYRSSPDERIKNSNVKTWNVSLPPGTGFIRQPYANTDICYSLPSLQMSLSSVQPVPCGSILTVGKTVLIEYVMADPSNASLVAKTIIVEIPAL